MMTKETSKNLFNTIAARAVILFIVGFILLVYPEATLSVLFFIMGAYWLIDGVITAYKSFQLRKEYSAWSLGFFIGIIGIIAGLIVVFHPGFSATVTTTFMVWFLGLAALVYGIGGLLFGIKLRNNVTGSTAMMIGGVLSIVFGIILLSSPYGTFITVVKTLGGITLLGGLILAYYAYKVKPKE